MFPSGPNARPSSAAQTLNARFTSYSSQHSGGGDAIASSSQLPPLRTPPPPLEAPSPPEKVSPPRRRLPQIPIDTPSQTPPPPASWAPSPNVPPAHPPERRASSYYSLTHPRPARDGYTESQTQESGWENEQREREIALARSLEEMRVSERALEERAQEARERDQIRQAEEESLREHIQSRQNNNSWETWEVGRGNGTYDGLANGGPSSFYHTPPARDHKTPPPPEHSDRRPPPTTTAGGSSGSTFFSDEFRVHAELIEQLKKWQAGHLPASTEWWEVVPAQMRDQLDKKEVERQGLIWEIFRSEQEYVLNLQAGLNGFFTPLATAPPNVMPPDKIQPFLDEVFHNINSIFPKHSRMVFRLQERQLESHPVIHSISDILIDSLFDLLVAYEKYLKHYPYAEARLRREMTKNEPFREYVNTCSRAPVVRKQDLGSFLVSPLGRLSKLGLVLRRLRQITPTDHEDYEQIPVVLDQIDSMLRSVQPGVDAATAKVKAWQIAQKLLFRRGERIDLDLNLGAEERALLMSGKICRRNRTERDWHGWTDLHLFLFDNYLVVTREETRPGGDPKDEDDRRWAVVSRPIPLEFLQLVGSDNDAGEHRRDMMIDYQRTKPVKVSTLLEPLTQPDRTIYPFHIEHKASRKGYSLYVDSLVSRKEWVSKIRDQLAVRRVYDENNQIFSIQTMAYFPPRRSVSRPNSIKRLSEGGQADSLFSMSSMGSSSSLNLHRTSTSDIPSPMSPIGQSDSPPSPSVGYSSSSGSSAKILCAAMFNRDGREYIIVGDSNGITIGFRDDSQSHRQIIESSSITDLFVLEPCDRLLVLATGSLYSFSLADIVPGSDPDQWMRVRKESGETLNGWGENVTLFRVGYRDGTLLVVYCSYNRLIAQSTLHVLEPLSIDPSSRQTRSLNGLLSKPHPTKASYRPYAQAFVPGTVHDISFYDRSIYVPTDRGFVVLDVLNLSKMASMPVFPDNYASNTILAGLKSRIASTKGLFIHRINESAYIVVYEAGCFWMDKTGKILNNGAYVSWETRPTSACVRGRHLILFEKEGRFLEIRDILNGGRLVEVIERKAGGLKLIGDDRVRPVMGVARSDENSRRELMFQLVETQLLAPITPRLGDRDRERFGSYRFGE